MVVRSSGGKDRPENDDQELFATQAEALSEEILNKGIPRTPRPQGESVFDVTEWVDKSMHPALDIVIEQMAYAGPTTYLLGIRNGVAYDVATIRETLWILRVSEDKQSQLIAYSQFAHARDSLIWTTHPKFPKPPFLALRRVFPITPSLFRRLIERFLQAFLFRNKVTWTVIEDTVPVILFESDRVKNYLIKTEALPVLQRRQYFARFVRWLIVERCRRVKRARFLRQLNRLQIACDEVGSFMLTYLDHHLFNLDIRSDFDEPPTFH